MPIIYCHITPPFSFQLMFILTLLDANDQQELMRRLTPY